MRTRNVFLLLSAVLVPLLAYADRGVAFCEYRYLEPLKQIRLTTGSIHLPGPVTLEMLNDPAREKEGIFSLEPHPMRAYKRVATVDGKKVEVEIGAQPPSGKGFGGAVATADLRVSVDGQLFVDVPMVSMTTNIKVLSIMPSDGMITVEADHDGKSAGGTIFLRSKEVLNEAWLAMHVRR